MLDFQRIRQDLQESLSLDKHPVAILVGAGCPSSIQIATTEGTTAPLIPDIIGLTEAVKKAMVGDAAFETLVKQFADDNLRFNIEDLLSRVRTLSRVVGSGDARGLNSAQLRHLEKELCRHIVDLVRKELPHTETPYHHLADWIGGVPRTSPVELFTTNYDLLLEQALEDRRLPYFDGFVGTRQPFFDLRAVEDDAIPPRWTRLWKVHGCQTWRLQADGKVVRARSAEPTGEGLLIHPSELKYDQSRRMPYLAMIDRLRAFMRRSSAFLVTVGYAFGDEHLNEVILQGLRSNPSAAGFGLMYKNLADETRAEEIAKRAPLNLTLLARDRGAVRARIGPWLSETSGAPPMMNKLGDFKDFAEFLRGFVPALGV